MVRFGSPSLNIAFIQEGSVAQENVEKGNTEHVYYNYNQVHELMKKWILLDNQSTTDIFCEKNILKNIRKVDETLKLHSNGGILVSNMKVDLP